MYVRETVVAVRSVFSKTLRVVKETSDATAFVAACCEGDLQHELRKFRPRSGVVLVVPKRLLSYIYTRARSTQLYSYV